MKAETTKRLFRALSSGNERDVDQICQTIIQEEQQKGHAKLASQLKTILEKRRLASEESRLAPSREGNGLSQDTNLSSLPRSRRDNELLVQYVPQEKLQHHMVLANHVEERFTSIEKENAARLRLAKFGLTHKRKILLYGPPGCGKTLGAERLAFNTGLPLLKVRMDALVSSYLGESASNLRKVFELAKKSPCVLLLDECDFIAKDRGSTNDVGEIPRIVNMLLILLDEFETHGLLVATTNLDRALDPALFRRFDDVIEVPRPSIREIERLLKLSLASLKVDKNVDLESYSSKLDGVSSATAVKVANSAAKHAILLDRDSIATIDLDHAISEIMPVAHT